MPDSRPPDLDALRAWLQAAGAGDHLLHEGYQGKVLLYHEGGRRWAVKVPGGWGPLRWLYRWALRREHRVYRHLAGLAGIPRCHGMLDDRFLILDYIDGIPYRYAEIEDRDHFFRTMYELLRSLHGRGVAHGDLKKKDNILVVGKKDPWIVDFGAALEHRRGLGRLGFSIFRQLDYNAWLKLKYNRRLENLTPEDAAFYHPTWPERLLRAIKQTYLRLRWPGGPPPKQRQRPRLPGPPSGPMEDDDHGS